MTIDGVSYPIEPPFLVMATQNPIESEGTYNLPEAQLDRFLFKLVVEYPERGRGDRHPQAAHAGVRVDRGVADQLDVVTSPAEVREMQKRAESVLVDDHVLGYIATLVRKTRQWPTLSLGASPRAGVAILRGARAVAALEGRAYILPDDVQDVVLPALRHRVMLTPEAEIEGQSADASAHRAYSVRRGSPAMKMIWPGRRWGSRSWCRPCCPGIIRERVGLAVRAGARPGGRHGGLADLFTLDRRGPVAEWSGTWAGCVRSTSPKTSSWSSKTRAGSARSMRLRDDVPDEFAAEPAAFEVTVPGRRQAILSYRFVPKKRGTYVFRAGGRARRQPPGVLARAIFVAAATPRCGFIPIFTRSRGSRCWRGATGCRPMGLRRSRRLGTDNEFERLRDYIEGDDPRHIDWRASARRSKLTSRAFQHNQSQRIIFLIDCGRLMAGDTGDGLSPLDHAFNAMLLLAHVALIRGDQVGLLAFSDRVRAYVAPGGGPRRINRLVHSVHNVFPEMVEPRYDRAFIELEQRCRKRSLVVLMTNLFDELSAQLAGDYLRNLTGRHLPLGVFLRDHDLFAVADRAPGRGPGALSGGGGGGPLELARARPGRAAARGVLTLDVFPEELTAVLVNRYLEIKARHLL